MVYWLNWGRAARLRSKTADPEKTASDRAGVPLIDPLESRCLLSYSANAVLAATPALLQGSWIQPLRTGLVTPLTIAAEAIAPTQIRVKWQNLPKTKRVIVYMKNGSSGTWKRMAFLSGQTTRYGLTGLSAGTEYRIRLQAVKSTGARISSTVIRVTTPDTPSPLGRVMYAGPLVITHGGTYSGNWQSLDPKTPAVWIRTNEPVIIENSQIRARGTLIRSFGNKANITIRNTTGLGLNPSVRGRYPGRFLNVDGFVNVVVANSYVEGTSGIYLYNYLGDHSAGETVTILRNKVKNIDGRYSDGAGGFLTGRDDNYYVQFFQINGVHGLTNAEIAWNEVINEPFKSRVEDNISIFASGGTAGSPLRIHDNYIQGGYPANPANDRSYSGGGIMLSDVGSSFVQAYNNQVINTTNYGIAISSGHDNEFYNNRIISSGLLPDGRRVASQNVGAYIWNQNGERGFSRNIGYDNVIGWNQSNGRNDWWVPDATSWARNQAISGNVNRSVESAEWTLWQNKLAAAAVRTGPQSV